MGSCRLCLEQDVAKWWRLNSGPECLLIAAAALREFDPGSDSRLYSTIRKQSHPISTGGIERSSSWGNNLINAVLSPWSWTVRSGMLEHPWLDSTPLPPCEISFPFASLLSSCLESKSCHVLFSISASFFPCGSAGICITWFSDLCQSCFWTAPIEHSLPIQVRGNAESEHIEATERHVERVHRLLVHLLQGVSNQQQGGTCQRTQSITLTPMNGEATETGV